MNNDLKEYFTNADNGCQTCPYRKGNICAEYSKSLEKSETGDYMQLDECMNDDDIARGEPDA